jgi:hypothetical protein
MIGNVIKKLYVLTDHGVVFDESTVEIKAFLIYPDDQLYIVPPFIVNFVAFVAPLEGDHL